MRAHTSAVLAQANKDKPVRSVKASPQGRLQVAYTRLIAQGEKRILRAQRTRETTSMPQE